MVIASCIIEMREKVRFNQHPVISVLLWILGTVSNLHVNDTYNNHNNKFLPVSESNINFYQSPIAKKLTPALARDRALNKVAMVMAEVNIVNSKPQI